MKIANLSRARAVFLIIALSLATGAATYLFNRIVVSGFWSFLKLDATPYSTGWNMALLSTVYVLCFGAARSLLNSCASFFQKSFGFLSQKQLWLYFKLNYTPLEMLSLNSGSTHVGLFYLFSGASQVTLGSYLLAYVVADIAFLDLFVIFVIQFFILNVVFSFNKNIDFSFSLERPLNYRRKLFFTLVLLAPTFYLAGVLAQTLLALYQTDLFRAFEALYLYFGYSIEESALLARQIVLQLFLTERHTLFSWVSGGHNQLVGAAAWQTLFIAFNYFNIFSCALFVPLILIWTTGGLKNKLALFVKLILMSFVISYSIPFLLLLVKAI